MWDLKIVNFRLANKAVKQNIRVFSVSVTVEQNLNTEQEKNGL